MTLVCFKSLVANKEYCVLNGNAKLLARRSRCMTKSGIWTLI